MSDERYGAGGCVLSDGRFAVFGGTDDDGDDLASCEALVLDNDGPVSGGERWEALPEMHQVGAVQVDSINILVKSISEFRV